jgi:hypothetical protein
MVTLTLFAWRDLDDLEPGVACCEYGSAAYGLTVLDTGTGPPRVAPQEGLLPGTQKNA